jgi:hypothetical protein
MVESARDAAMDTLKMLPFLLGIYLLIEWMEGRFGDAMVSAAKKARRSGPWVAALVGCVPQCGFSSVGSALYARRAISIGTLMAVYLATSDEALPILLSRPDKVWLVAPIVLTKVVVAIITGFLVDFLARRSGMPEVADESVVPDGDHAHSHGEMDHHAHCEHEHMPLWRRVAGHTAQVAGFVFAISFALSYAMATLGSQGMSRMLLAHSVLQPPAAALVGLIPNCAASVAITQALIHGNIGLGAGIAGLLPAGGIGLLVLMRENRPVSDTVRVMALLYLISAGVGLAVQTVAG